MFGQKSHLGRACFFGPRQSFGRPFPGHQNSQHMHLSFFFFLGGGEEIDHLGLSELCFHVTNLPKKMDPIDSGVENQEYLFRTKKLGDSCIV